MQLRFDKNLYSKYALFKSSYTFTNRAYVHLDVDEKDYIVDIIPKEECVIDVQEFQNEMLYQMTKQMVNENTKEIRKLIVARAMASTLIEQTGLEHVEKTNNIEADESILKDWFGDKE